MAATTTATIKLGSYTKQVTKASADKDAVTAQCVAIAQARSLQILVKQDYTGRWQGFCSRRNPSGATGWAKGEYVIEPGAGRRARRMDNQVEGGRVYLAETANAAGPAEATIIL